MSVLFAVCGSRAMAAACLCVCASLVGASAPADWLVNSACRPGMSGCVGSGGVRDVLRVGVPFTGLYPGAGPEGPSLCGRGGGVGCGRY